MVAPQSPGGDPSALRPTDQCSRLTWGTAELLGGVSCKSSCAFLASAHDLSSWNLYEKMDSLLTFRRHRGSLPTEVRAEGVGCVLVGRRGGFWGERVLWEGMHGGEGREREGS